MNFWRAIEETGLICEAYSRFQGYSLGNRFAALLQCEMRGLEPGPLNSFNGWRKLGYDLSSKERSVKMRGKYKQTPIPKHCQRRWLPARVPSGSCYLLAQQRQKASEVAVELNVSGWSLNRWRKELELQHADATPATGELNALELAKENGRLRRENESLARQRDILKKAITIFSADNPIGGSR